MKKSNSISDIRAGIDILRESGERGSDSDSPASIPYSAQDVLMTDVLASSKQEFGADYNKIKNPMLYYPKDGDVTLSGIIPAFNDAKFQFRYKDMNSVGCYVWTDPYMAINDQSLLILQKMYGVYKNWKDEISKSEDYKPSGYHDPSDMQDNEQGGGRSDEAGGQGIVRGDDLD